jgi:Lysine methyltransferase
MKVIADDDSDDSIEGQVARSLFLDSEGEEEDSGSHQSDAASLFRTDHRRGATSEDDDVSERAECRSSTTKTTQILHVRIASKSSGGTIAERVWPAAKHLAEFLLDLAMRAGGDTHVVLPFRGSESPIVPNEDAATARDLRHENLKQKALAMVRALLLQSETPGSPLSIIELGAGVGLTGLELASQLRCQVLLTDLPVGISLLRQNFELNRELCRFQPAGGGKAVTVQRLEWGNEEDVVKATRWCDERASNRPVLIVGSDCVYWEELHEPLERTIFSLLSRCAPGSLCVLAGMRRWKRDNAFYQTLGRRTRTATQQLRCTCVQESVSRSDSGQREVMRVFVVEITARAQS